MTTVTLPATWADGDGINEAKLNAVSALQTWYFGNRPMYHGTANNNYTLTNNAWTVIPLCTASGVINGTKRGFTHTEYTSAITATVPGWYDFVFQGGFQAVANGLTGIRGVAVVKNGMTSGEWAGVRLGPYNDSATGCCTYSGGGTVWLNGTTDYVELWQYSGSSGATDIHTAYTNPYQKPQLGIWWIGRDQT